MKVELIQRGGMYGWIVRSNDGAEIGYSLPRFPSSEKALENAKFLHPKAKPA